MTEIQTYYLQLHTQTLAKKKKNIYIYIAKTVEKCEVPEMKVEGEEEETGRPIKR